MRGKLFLFLLSAVAIFAAMCVLYSAGATIERLNVVEAERDQWQRPAAVIDALDLKSGDFVADLGSGAGYFSLRLSPVVGKQGEVLAIDLRKLSLAFLWIRTVGQSPHNIRVHIGSQDDPRLPRGRLDAVLIANTYHEFENPLAILDHVFRALRPGGCLVIVDRSPHSAGVADGHEIAMATVEHEVQDRGFEVLRHDHKFIDHPVGGSWWLLVARKPQAI